MDSYPEFYPITPTLVLTTIISSIPEAFVTKRVIPVVYLMPTQHFPIGSRLYIVVKKAKRRRKTHEDKANSRGKLKLLISPLHL